MSPPEAPQGLAFLELGERLRQRGQLDAAASVAIAGLGRYPAMAEAHDLLARVRADQGEDAAAIAAWRAALECEPGHVGALKGLAFLAFRARDMLAAERHLEAAAARSPHDATILAALDRVRATRPAPSEEHLRLEDPASGLLLADAHGMRLTGGVGAGTGDAQADATAAEAAGLAREAARTARFVGLGDWRQLVIEGRDARAALQPVGDAVLLVCRTSATPPGRLVATAMRAAQAARDWLGAGT